MSEHMVYEFVACKPRGGEQDNEDVMDGLVV